MKAIRYIAFILLLPLLLTTCMREPFPEMANGSDGWLLTFSAPPAPEIVVSTKSTMTDENSEFDVYNLYVLVFDKEGNKIWGQEFKSSNKVASSPAIGQWTYSHTTKTGTVHLQSARSSDANSADCKIAIIANLNSEMVNVTPEQLQGVANWTAMCNVQATLLQKITSRSGYFPMYGELTGVKLEDTGMTFTAGSELNLRRLDARIEFYVKADANPDYGIQDFVPLTWQIFNVPVVSSVVEGEDVATKATQFFDGEEINFETETRPDPVVKYVGTDKEICTHGFSFYMMENVKVPESTPTQGWEYKDRDKQVKEADGRNKVDTNNKPVFQYAPDLATYVVLKGRLVIKKENEVTHVVETKHADVRYVIHLGNFKTNMGDFSIKRNHKYTYNITIQGINHIHAEVTEEGNPEQEPGASGQIVVPVKKIFTCDSHYSTHALVFDKTEILQENLRWWVLTPFNEDGVSSKADGSFWPDKNYDYKWVEFRVNYDKRSANPDDLYEDHAWMTYQPHGSGPVTSTDYPYVVNPEAQHPSPTMYINELMAYLKAAAAGSVTPGTNAIFDSENKIVVTAFVNEYYYEKHPFKEAEGYDATLWRQFVNQPMRTMCIGLSDDETSPDKESREEKADYIIQQYSIQSVYNVLSSDLADKAVWGAEYYIDDNEGQCKYYAAAGNYDDSDRHNDDTDNGRYDTLIEWDLGLWGTDKSYSTGETYVFDDRADKLKSWGDYMYYNYDPDYDYVSPPLSYPEKEPPFLKDEDGKRYRYLRYSCMSRNRDNNGNGMIDEDEIRWYTAASNQLINLYLGSYGIEGPSGLYQRTPEQRASSSRDVWRQHYLASDIYRKDPSKSYSSSKYPRAVWAEQGPNGSSLNYGYNYSNNTSTNSEQTSNFSVRCVRNLGFDSAGDASHGYDITYSPASSAPAPLIVVKAYKDSGEPYTGSDIWTGKNGDYYKDVHFEFDCSRVNQRSRRYYTDRELAPHNEFDEAACLYTTFQTTSIVSSLGVDPKKNVVQINSTIDEGTNPYCPVGYRLPNVREVSVMCYYLSATVRLKFMDNDTNNRTFARTYYSFGKKGNHRTDEWGWGFSNEKTLMASDSGASGGHKTSSLRCVKDVKQ